MKFPKLRHAGLCNILIFLPALFLFFAIGFNIPLANWGTPKWVLALNFLLGCAVSLGYLILGAFPLLYADPGFFSAAGVKAFQPGIPHWPGEIRMGEYALYCGLGDRVAVLTYTKQEEKKHSRSKRTLLPTERAARAEPAGAGSPRRSRKAAAPGLKAGSSPRAIVLKRRQRNNLVTQNAGAAFGSARAVFIWDPYCGICG